MKEIPSRDDLGQPATKGDVVNLKSHIEEVVEGLESNIQDQMEEEIEDAMMEHENRCEVRGMYRYQIHKHDRGKVRKALDERYEIRLAIQSVIIGIIIGVGQILGLI